METGTRSVIRRRSASWLKWGVLYHGMGCELKAEEEEIGNR